MVWHLVPWLLKKKILRCLPLWRCLTKPVRTHPPGSTSLFTVREEGGQVSRSLLSLSSCFLWLAERASCLSQAPCLQKSAAPWRQAPALSCCWLLAGLCVGGVTKVVVLVPCPAGVWLAAVSTGEPMYPPWLAGCCRQLRSLPDTYFMLEKSYLFYSHIIHASGLFHSYQYIFLS